MKTKNQTKQWYVFVLLFVAGVMAYAQERGYLDSRIKIGDIFYVNALGEECFMDYRLWDKDNPVGEARGVVCYSYYGTVPYGEEGEAPAWHGWIVSVDESAELLSWAPENTICYDTCVALFPVEGVNTPYNPTLSHKNVGIGDTCGWQNQYRLLEFIYTAHHSTLSEATSPAFHYVFAEKNGVTDFSVKPVMGKTSWYMPSYGQFRFLYGNLGCINAAMKACGGTMFNNGIWYTSTEVGKSNMNAIWNVHYQGYVSPSTGYYKRFLHTIRAFRNF